MYDYIIIGGGPCGLTLAYYLGKINKKCLLIDKNNNIGGCHRVNRVNGLFTEHGPRIYSNSYVNTISLLKDMNLNFYDLFVPYNFNITNIGSDSIYNMKLLELLSFVKEYVKLIFNNNNGKNISMSEFMNKNNFSDKTKDYIDRLCRLTDGASKEHYSLFEFLQLLNQNIFYKIYQPKLPNDIGLFKLWKNKLDEIDNINIILNTNVIKINEYNNKIIDIDVKDNNNKVYKIKGKTFLFAIPPKPYYNLIMNSSNKIQNSYNNFDLFNFTKNNSYMEYIPITFHWNKKLDLPKVWGFPKSEWGIAYIVLTDYMKFKNKDSKTVISTCITITNNKSKLLNKYPDNCNKEELINEVFRQLKYSYPELLKPTHSILNPLVKRINNKWIETDTGYVATNYNQTIPAQNPNIKNLYNIGTQNGKTNYHFTSLESAITNAIKMINLIEPETIGIVKLDNKIISLIDIIRFILILILIIIIINIRWK
jgi:hypothetical protein